jgi:hypothetical protein
LKYLLVILFIGFLPLSGLSQTEDDPVFAEEQPNSTLPELPPDIEEDLVDEPPPSPPPEYTRPPKQVPNLKLQKKNV